MKVLARKITKGKWASADPGAVERISADTITAELRTSRGTLSLWACPTAEPDDIVSAALAIAAGPDRQRVENIDLLWLPVADVTGAGFEIQQTRGSTSIERLAMLHRDVIVPDYARLGVMARVFATAYRAGQYMRVREKQLGQLLHESRKRGDVIWDDLSDGLRSALQKFEP